MPKLYNNYHGTLTPSDCSLPKRNKSVLYKIRCLFMWDNLVHLSKMCFQIISDLNVTPNSRAQYQVTRIIRLLHIFDKIFLLNITISVRVCDSVCASVCACE